jgi:hypothetical protein
MEWQKPLTAFPDQLSPVFVRDLRQVLRSPLIVVSFLILQITVLAITGLELALLRFTDGSISAPFLSAALSSFLTIGFGVALPLTSLGALQPEIGTGRNIELLLAASLSRWKVVRGKWFTATAMSLLLLISITPYLTVRYFLGSVDLIGAIEGFFSNLTINAVMNAIVIGASGFRSYIARGLSILFFGAMFSISISVSLASTSGPSPVQKLVAVIAGAVILVLAMQVGRARLKLFSTPENPPSTSGIFVIALVFPFLQGIGLASGGVIALMILSLLWLALAFLVDRPHRPSYRYRTSSSPA